MSTVNRRAFLKLFATSAAVVVAGAKLVADTKVSSTPAVPDPWPVGRFKPPLPITLYFALFTSETMEI